MSGSHEAKSTQVRAQHEAAKARCQPLPLQPCGPDACKARCQPLAVQPHDSLLAALEAYACCTCALAKDEERLSRVHGR